MADELLHKRRKLPIRRIIFGTGIGLILLGYVFLCIQPDTAPSIAVTRAIFGLVAVIIGAMLWLGAIFFSE